MTRFCIMFDPQHPDDAIHELIKFDVTIGHEYVGAICIWYRHKESKLTLGSVTLSAKLLSEFIIDALAAIDAGDEYISVCCFYGDMGEDADEAEMYWSYSIKRDDLIEFIKTMPDLIAEANRQITLNNASDEDSPIELYDTLEGILPDPTANPAGGSQ